jgi:hypothetical protein
MLDTVVTPPVLESFAQALKLEVTDCDAPLMVNVAVQDCEPVPCGGGTPGEIVTVNFH